MKIRKEGKRKILFALTTTLALILATNKVAQAGNGTAIDPNSANVLTLAVYGDSPYGTTPTDTQQTEATPAFINSINADPKVDLVIHVGDIHSGKQYCTEAYDRTLFSLWTAFKNPLIYTPGDNEWTDCQKSGEGGNKFDANGNPVDYQNGDPIANLELIRSIFFANPGYSLGGRKKQVQSQAQYYNSAYPTDAKFVENVMWMQSKVLFVTINLPGGSNNDKDVWYGAPIASAAQNQERSERTAADLRWLDTAFAIAATNKAEAIAIVAQADMWDTEKGIDHQTEYEPIVQSIASHSTAFGKPVLMFNGDSHVYRSDNPLSPTASCTWELSTPCTSVAYIHPAGYNVPNFHRVVVHGSTSPLEWLKLTINPRANNVSGPNTFGPFSWERIQPQI
ncbi:MAG: metallophosphoesterase [Aulosira sp. ZfuVER01]|nr:metallophosphoesterase [Aulosira sp. ZfuVER01]MDZ8002628.1 metallophosphoesterase [Aulosira sp. DedVER01a]MDZ8050694.1 metallophosphoesterase [Aulosira sp. ZfuCHP01]